MGNNGVSVRLLLGIYSMELWMVTLDFPFLIRVETGCGRFQCVILGCVEFKRRISTMFYDN